MWGQVKKVVKEKQMRGARDLKDFGKEKRRKLEGKLRRICHYVQKNVLDSHQQCQRAAYGQGQHSAFQL